MAAVLMVTGIALLGTITAAVASWFVNVVLSAATESAVPLVDSENDLSDRVIELTAAVRLMHAELIELRTELGTGHNGDVSAAATEAVGAASRTGSGGEQACVLNPFAFPS